MNNRASGGGTLYHHKNARLTYARRVELVHLAAAPGAKPGHLAEHFGVSRQTVRKWCQRFAAEGLPGLRDRSSRPHSHPRQLPRAQRRQIERQRRRRWSSVRIAQHYHIPLSTVVTVQRRLGLNRLSRLEPPRPIQRYEHARPGALVHLDVKKLGRIVRIGERIHRRPQRSVRAGWEYVHVAIDDCTRLAYAEVLPRETGAAAAAFLRRALAWYAAQGVTVAALLTDNGGCYRSRELRAAVAQAGVRHRFTRPFRPQTNGKAERLIRTLLQEWAYGQTYRHSVLRTLALPRYLRFYNTERRHSALGYHTPAHRLAERL